MSNTPSTPVKVPSSAANYTPATLDPDLRSQINTVLLKDGHVNKIQEALLHALNSHNTNWPTTIQKHALTLLRTGECTTYPQLLRRVLDDVRHDSALTNPASSSTNGKASINGDAAKVNGAAASDRPGLAIPESVVEESLRVTRESLEAVCEIEESGP
ncbi:Fc.00g077290.m01.CDS01 [Cosmosporella sp. VM-42]